jgi:hypothetical protein
MANNNIQIYYIYNHISLINRCPNYNYLNEFNSKDLNGAWTLFEVCSFCEWFIGPFINIIWKLYCKHMHQKYDTMQIFSFRTTLMDYYN